MTRPRSRSFTRGGPKRLTEWSGLADQGYVNVSTTASTLISSVAFEDPGTIVRARGRCSIRPQTVVADLDVVGAFGIGLVSAEALAIGITALPTPQSDADWGGWMVWRSFAYRLEFVDATGTFQIDWGFEVDSKAMRLNTSRR